MDIAVLKYCKELYHKKSYPECFKFVIPIPQSTQVSLVEKIYFPFLGYCLFLLGYIGSQLHKPQDRNQNSP